MKVKCDICKKKKKCSSGKKSKIYHFTGFMVNHKDGSKKWNHHWHICTKCCKSNFIYTDTEINVPF